MKTHQIYKFRLHVTDPETWYTSYCYFTITHTAYGIYRDFNVIQSARIYEQRFNCVGTTHSFRNYILKNTMLQRHEFAIMGTINTVMYADIRTKLF